MPAFGVARMLSLQASGKLLALVLASLAVSRATEIFTPETCVWLDPVRGSYVSGNDLKHLTNVNVDECKKACVDEKSFNCFSFDYKDSTNECWLQRADRFSVRLIKSASFDYYERDCRGDFPDACQWEAALADVAISGHRIVTLTAQSVDNCKQACADEESFHCLSIEYTTSGVCYLQDVNRYRAPLVVSQGVTYYERNCQADYLHCNGLTQNAEWAEPLNGVLSPFPVRRILKLDVEGCKAACLQEDMFHCRSFDYYRPAEQCNLHELNRRDYKYLTGGNVGTHVNYDYYELVSCPEGDAPEEVRAADCQWLDVFDNYYIPGNDKKVLGGKEVEDCQKICEEETSFVCMSFDYYKPTKTCYFHEVDRFTKALSVSTAFKYYERNCQPDFPDHCQWASLPGFYLPGNDMAILKVLDEDECQEECETRVNFHCMSFDFRKTDNTCFLQTASRDNAAIQPIFSPPMEYRERYCQRSFQNCSGTSQVDWTGPVYGRYMPASALKVITGHAEEECKLACLQETSFRCRSVNYELTKAICSMFPYSSQEIALREAHHYVFYEIKSCGAQVATHVDDQSCTWVRVNNTRSTSGTFASLKGTIEECQTSCVSDYGRSTTKCQSFDYYEAAGTCYLHSETRFDRSTVADANKDYFERQCPEFDPASQCVWQIRYGYKMTPFLKTITGIDIAKCIEKCEEEDSFICSSVSYNHRAGVCYISTANRYTAKMIQDDDFEYRERNCRPEFSSCHAASDATWVGPFIGYQLPVGLKTSVLYLDSVEACKAACLQLDVGHCLSIEYEASSGACTLNMANRGDGDLKLKQTADYYEIASCPTEEIPVPKQSCKWVGPEEDKCISGHDRYARSPIDEDDCRAHCMADSQGWCKGVDYVVTSRVCYFNTASRDDVALANCNNFRYYEKDCSDSYTEECQWTEVQQNFRMGKYSYYVTADNASECMKACEESTKINCVSVDYLPSLQRCFLSLYDRTDYKISAGNDYQYYERLCDDARRSCGTLAASGTWSEPTYGYYLNTPVLSTLTGGRTVEECKTACVQGNDIRCKSFDFVKSSGVCYLRGRLSTEEPTAMVVNAVYDHYDLTGCTGPAPAPENVECTWLEAIDRYYISGRDFKSMTRMDAESCKKECEESKSYFCRSFDLIGTTCYLQEADRSSAVLSAGANWKYYERHCGANRTGDCQWERRKNIHMPFADDKKLTGVTPDQCKKACEEEVTFHCMSFDYNYASSFCFLSRSSRYESILSPLVNYDYYERVCYDEWRTCNYHSDATWTGPIHGRRSNGKILLTLTYITPDECKKACLQQDDFHCRSFDFVVSAKTCYLKAANRETSNTDIYDANYDHYELDKCTGPLPEIKAPRNCTWRPVLDNYFISGQDKASYTNIDLDDCLDMCEAARSYECNSIDYYKPSRTCYLQSADRTSTKLAYSTTFQYVERDCSPTFPEQCSWEGPLSRFQLAGHDLATLTSQTAEECKDNCEKEQSFQCMSFDFVRDSDTCRLHQVDRYSVAVSTSNPTDYYERNCNNAFKNCSTASNATWADPVYGFGLSATVHKTITPSTLEQCKTACLQVANFHCRTIEFLRNVDSCYLMSATPDSVPVTAQAHMEYHQLLDCNEVPPVTCGENMSYQKCGNPCHPTCSDPEGAKCPDVPCEDGCFCDPGFVYDGQGACFKPSLCGCALPGSSDRLQVGDAVLLDSCTTHCTCEADNTDAACTATQCQGAEVCSLGGDRQACVCQEPNYLKDGQCVAPPQCAQGKEFKCSVASCEPTCTDPDVPANCSPGNETCQRGCYCKDGLVEAADGTCGEVAAVCGCPVPNSSQKLQVGQNIILNNCTRNCTCLEHGSEVSCQNMECPENYVCEEDSSAGGECVCKHPFDLFKGSCTHICKLPKRAGNCDGAETRYFFSTRKKRCKQFEYSGCKGNANNFATKKECNSLCEEFKTPAECLLPVETGSCDKEITRYYFKADEELCKRFTYTGCDGNQNSFESKEACRLYCKRA